MIKLGKTDLCVSPVCLGCDVAGTAVPENDFFDILDRFTEEGGNMVDTANVYCRWLPPYTNSSEQTIGKWIKNNRSKQLVIASKGGHYDLATKRSRINKEDIQSDIESSLKALGVERIDLYYLHRDDLSLPIGEILDMMNGFVKKGVIGYFAASNYTAKRLSEADEYAAAKGIMTFSAVSNQYSLASPNAGVNVNMDPTIVIDGEDDIMWHRKSGTPLLPYQSTARGYFAKKTAGTCSPELEKIFGSQKNNEIYNNLLKKSADTGFSVQTLTITELAKSEKDFRIVPVTSVNSVKRLKDVTEAMHILSENS